MPFRPPRMGGFGLSVNGEKIAEDKEVARRVINFIEERRLLFGRRHSRDEQ